MYRNTLIALSMLVVAASAASAQIDTRGKTQFGIAGFGSVAQNSGFASGQVSLTQFLTKNIEAGADVALTASMQKTPTFDDFGNPSGSTNATSVSGDVFGRIRYNFVGQSMTVPYISLGAGTSLSSDSYGGQKPLELQAGAGFKEFLNERVSFNGEVNYTSITVQGQSSSSMNFLVGLSIYTGGSK